MSKHFFDYDDDDFAMSISDSIARDSDGNLMMRMGDEHCRPKQKRERQG